MYTDVKMTHEDQSELQFLLANVQANLLEVQQEWQLLLSLLPSLADHQEQLADDELVVSRNSLNNLAVEMDQMKRLLPTLLNQSLAASATKVMQLAEESESVRKERDGLIAQVAHWKNQLSSAVSDTQGEKMLQLDLQVQIRSLTDQLAQQSEFSFSMGSVCCTLLWRLSKLEQCVHSLVSGSKSAEMLTLVSSSVRSFLATYVDDQWPEPDSDEAGFILALCGTVTNIAASALGREHLVSSSQGKNVADTFVDFIKAAPIGKSASMKSLMLMCLYNMSINQKGIRYLYSKPRLIPIFCWHLKEETDTDCRVNTLRLLHSIISDESSLHVIHEIKENLPLSLLQHLTTSLNRHVQDLSLEIIMEMRQFDTEQ